MKINLCNEIFENLLRLHTLLIVTILRHKVVNTALVLDEAIQTSEEKIIIIIGNWHTFIL